MNTETPHTETAPSPQPVRATWNFSADSFLEAAASYSDAARETMLAALRWCIDPRHPVSRDDFAARVDYDPTTIYKFYANKYINPETKQPQPPPEKFLARVRTFLKLEKERFEGGQTEFVTTPTAKSIFAFCDNARESCSMAILSGPSHIGKSWATEYYKQENNHGRTIYCRVQAASGLGGMVRTLASACGISDKANTAALVDRIKRSLTKDSLIIIDECHLLANTYRIGSFFACVEVLREIYDATQCGMVLIWTRIDSLTAHSQRELQQVWRRGVHKLMLPAAPTRGDVSAIVRAAGLEFPDRTEKLTVGGVTEAPYEILRQISQAEGLKAITERIRYARKFATKAGETLDWKHFVRAHLTILKQQTPAETEW